MFWFVCAQEDLTEEDAVRIIKELKAGGKPKAGPQYVPVQLLVYFAAVL